MISKILIAIFGINIEWEKEYLTNVIEKSKRAGLKEMQYPPHFESHKISALDKWLEENNCRVYFHNNEKKITWHHCIKKGASHHARK